MAERASEVRALLPCPSCGRTLVPAPAESSVDFHCKTGHELSLADLLHTQSMVVRRGLEDLVAEWSLQRQGLVRTVELARMNGHVDVADIFNRHAKSLEHRILKVRDAFSLSDSSKRIRLPDAIRTA